MEVAEEEERSIHMLDLSVGCEYTMDVDEGRHGNDGLSLHGTYEKCDDHVYPDALARHTKSTHIRNDVDVCDGMAHLDPPLFLERRCRDLPHNVP